MNFLEGLKRLFIIAGALLAAGAAVGGWFAKESWHCEYAWKSDADLYRTIVEDRNRSYKWMNAKQAYSALGHSDSYGSKTRSKALQDHIQHMNFALPDETVHCGPEWQQWGKQVGYSLLFGALAIAGMTIFWLLCRWVLLGFFPRLRNE